MTCTECLVSLGITDSIFEHVSQEYLKPVRLGILIASVLSALAGYLLLRHAPSEHKPH